MKDEASWALRPPQSRIAALDILVHLEAQQGNAEASLLALEKLRFEQERLNALRSGVETDVRQSAELATLERIAATTGNLPAPAMERLRELRSQVEQASATVSEDLRPPTLENLTAALKELPERTNLIVYHLSPRGITVWRASRTQALTGYDFASVAIGSNRTCKEFVVSFQQISALGRCAILIGDFAIAGQIERQFLTRGL